MKVEFVMFAEAINRSASGPLNILGEFNTLYSNDFPFVRPAMAFIIRLSGDIDDRETHRIRAELGLSGSDVRLAEFESTASRQVDRPDQPLQGDIIVDAYGLVFPAEGEYRMDVLVDNELAYSKALQVLRTPQAVR